MSADKLLTSLDVLAEEGVSALFGTVRPQDHDQMEVLARILGVREHCIDSIYTCNDLETHSSANRIPSSGVILYVAQGTSQCDLAPYPPHEVFRLETEFGFQSGFAGRFLPVMLARRSAYGWYGMQNRPNPSGFSELRQKVLSMSGVFLNLDGPQLAVDFYTALQRLAQISRVGRAVPFFEAQDLPRGR